MIVLSLAGTQRAHVTDYGTSRDGGVSDHETDQQDHPQPTPLQLAMLSGKTALVHNRRDNNGVLSFVSELLLPIPGQINGTTPTPPSTTPSEQRATSHWARSC